MLAVDNTIEPELAACAGSALADVSFRLNVVSQVQLRDVSMLAYLAFDERIARVQAGDVELS